MYNMLVNSIFMTFVQQTMQRRDTIIPKTDCLPLLERVDANVLIFQCSHKKTTTLRLLTPLLQEFTKIDIRTFGKIEMNELQWAVHPGTSENVIEANPPSELLVEHVSDGDKYQFSFYPGG